MLTKRLPTRTRIQHNPTSCAYVSLSLGSEDAHVKAKARFLRKLVYLFARAARWGHRPREPEFRELMRAADLVVREMSASSSCDSLGSGGYNKKPHDIHCMRALSIPNGFTSLSLANPLVGNGGPLGDGCVDDGGEEELVRSRHGPGVANCFGSPPTPRKGVPCIEGIDWFKRQAKQKRSWRASARTRNG